MIIKGKIWKQRIHFIVIKNRSNTMFLMYNYKLYEKTAERLWRHLPKAGLLHPVTSVEVVSSSSATRQGNWLLCPL